MASSSSVPAIPASLSIPVSEKLTRENYLLWRVQVLPAIRAAQFEGFLDGSEGEPPKTLTVDKDSKKMEVANPDYVVWRVRDQHVLTYLVTSLSREVLAGVSSCSTAADLWTAITRSFASQSQSHILHLRTQIGNMRKGDMSVTMYFSKMRRIAEEMAAAGKPLDDDDVVSHILNGLDAEYNPLVEQVTGMADSINLDELYARLLSTEARLESQKETKESFQMVANTAARGRGGSFKQENRGRCDGGRGNQGDRGGFGGGFGCGGTGRGNPNNPYKDHQCQVCGKYGHIALRCWKRFDKNYNGPEKTAAAAVASYNMDTAWYADSAATDHITGNLDKLTMKQDYNGHDQVHTANGAGMTIKHIGQSTVITPSRNIHLNDVLHVPQATRNLASVHRLTTDNDVFLELHSEFFFVKDRQTRRILLHGKCRNGLYPIPSLEHTPSKHVLSVVKTSTDRWYGRLGHPTFATVHRILRDNSLPFESNKALAHVCDACQQAKSRQLPFPKSVSVSKAPLELVFSDVWGPAPTSVGRHDYYVSFIDDYSKFTWIYLIKHKSEVFQKFRDFQAHAERLLNCKILSMQTDWGGEYQKLSSFF